MATNSYFQLDSIAPASDSAAIAPVAQQPLLKRLAPWFINACQPILNVLFVKHTEPQITQLNSPNGEVFWEIHDPNTSRTVYCMTEHEVLEWLDSCCYRTRG